MSVVSTSASLNVAWDGSSPATAPAGSTLVLDIYDLASVSTEVTGTFNATVTYEGTFDTITWFAVNCFNVDRTSGTNSLAAPGRRLIQVAGIARLRARMNPRVSGTAVVAFDGSWTPV